MSCDEGGGVVGGLLHCCCCRTKTVSGRFVGGSFSGGCSAGNIFMGLYDSDIAETILGTSLAETKKTLLES